MELMGTLVVRDKSDPIQSMMMHIGLEEEFRKPIETNVNKQIENLIIFSPSTNHSKTGDILYHIVVTLYKLSFILEP